MTSFRTVVEVDVTKKAWEQPKTKLHNRWHPDIPAVTSVQQNEIFRVECVDWTGGQIKNDDSADDIRDVNLTHGIEVDKILTLIFMLILWSVHFLSGPIKVEGAKAGDLLKVEILDLGALPGDEWGFTGTFTRENGGGLLTDHYPEATKACWDFEGIYATSRHISGVRFAGNTHPGLIGTSHCSNRPVPIY
jgi:formamidase